MDLQVGLLSVSSVQSAGVGTWIMQDFSTESLGREPSGIDLETDRDV